MLDCRSDYMASSGSAVMGLSPFANATNRKVVCLSPTRDEHNLVGAGADQCRDLATRTIDCGARLLTKEVHAGSIAEFFRQIWQHRLDNALVGGRRGTVIQVNPACLYHSIDLMLR